MVDLSTLGNAFVGAVAVGALVLTITSVAAYRRERLNRFLLVGLAFALVFVRALLAAWWLWEGGDVERLIVWTTGMDAGVLVLLYAAIVR